MKTMRLSSKKALSIAALLLAGAGAMPAQQRGLCHDSAMPGKSWFGDIWMRGGSNANVQVTFGTDQTFEYTVARGARIILAVTGQFWMQRSGERAARWPSACLITFRPTEVTVAPQTNELNAMEERGLLNGRNQVFRIDGSSGRGETMILLNAAIGDPTSTSDLYFQKK